MSLRALRQCYWAKDHWGNATAPVTLWHIVDKSYVPEVSPIPLPVKTKMELLLLRTAEHYCLATDIGNNGYDGSSFLNKHFHMELFCYSAVWHSVHSSLSSTIRLYSLFVASTTIWRCRQFAQRIIFFYLYFVLSVPEPSLLQYTKHTSVHH